MKRGLSSHPSTIETESGKRLRHSKGHFGLFLCREKRFLNQSQLIGTETNFQNEKIKHISNFLLRHTAMNILLSIPDERDLSLQEREGLPSDIGTNNIFSPNGIEIYTKECLSFSHSQIEEIIQPEMATENNLNCRSKIITDFISMLESIFGEIKDGKAGLQMKDIQSFHDELSKLLSKNHGNDATARKISANSTWRKKNNRSSTFTKCPCEEIPNQIIHLLKGMKMLKKKMKRSNKIKSEDSKEEKFFFHAHSLIKGLTIASAFLYGIVEIHPFCELNSCVTQICLNWILRRHTTIPFPICVDLSSVFTLAEKTAPITKSDEMYSSFESMRSNMNSYYQRKSSKDLKNIGIFQPIMLYLLDQIHKQTTNCMNHLSSKFDRANAQGIDRTIRRARENSIVDGVCVICLGENPNMATLCCGNVVHMNCLAEWLSRKGSCMSCRKDLPMLKIEENEKEEEEEEDEAGNLGPYLSTTYDPETGNPILIFNDYINYDSGADSYDQSSFEDDDDSFESWNSDTFPYRHREDTDENNDSEISTDFSSSSSDTAYSSSSSEFFTYHSEPAANEDRNRFNSSLPSLVTNLTRHGQRCREVSCTNTAARNCSNGCCARCCHLHSTFCSRHQST